MKKPIAASLFLFVLAPVACSNFPQPTPTALPTLTFTTAPTQAPIFEPTETPVPPTETPEALSALVPQGEPAAEWQGIPIMPGAITGEGDAEGYVFTIKATPQEVREYYQLELGKLGWQPFATGDGNASSMLIFMKNASATLTVSILAKDDEVLVLLVK